jgi:hypothetical protein
MVILEWTRAQFHNSRRVSKVNVLKKTKEAAFSQLSKTKKRYMLLKEIPHGISRRNNLLFQNL